MTVSVNEFGTLLWISGNEYHFDLLHSQVNLQQLVTINITHVLLCQLTHV